jgi:hypothetical protein
MKRGKSHAMLLWGVIGLLSAVVIFLITPMVPWTARDLEPHKRLVQAVLFTVCAFLLWVSFFWRWRRLGAFWVSICVFLLLHVLCIFLYSTYYVRPILVWQWSIFLYVEFYAAGFFVDWLTRKLSRSHPDELDHKALI